MLSAGNAMPGITIKSEAAGLGVTSAAMPVTGLLKGMIWMASNSWKITFSAFVEPERSTKSPSFFLFIYEGFITILASPHSFGRTKRS